MNIYVCIEGQDVSMGGTDVDVELQLLKNTNIIMLMPSHNFCNLASFKELTDKTMHIAMGKIQI